MIIDGYTQPQDNIEPDTHWDDLRVEPTARTTGANAPTFEKWYDNGLGSRGVYLYTFDNAAGGSEKEVFFTMQMPHDWYGTDIHLHVHWVADTTAINSRVEWGLEYTWIDIDGAFPATTLILAYVDTASTTGTTTKVHRITEFTAITPSATQDGISSVLIGRLSRNSASLNDTYTGDVGLLYIDAHYERDSFGSNQEYIK